MAATWVEPLGAPLFGAPATVTPRAVSSWVITWAACCAGSAADFAGANDAKPSSTNKAPSGPPTTDGWYAGGQLATRRWAS